MGSNMFIYPTLQCPDLSNSLLHLAFVRMVVSFSYFSGPTWGRLSTTASKQVIQRESRVSMLSTAATNKRHKRHRQQGEGGRSRAATHTLGSREQRRQMRKHQQLQRSSGRLQSAATVARR